jgi:two-component sensor histidine kinase
MVNKASRFFQTFIATGILPGMHEAEQRRIRLLNFFYLLTSFTLACATIETFIDEGKREGLILTIATLIFQLGAIPLFTNRRKFAEFYFIAVGNVTLFCFDNMYGKEAGTFLYYFPLVIFVAFLVDFKDILQVLVHLGITFAFIIISFYVDHQFLYRPFPAEMIRASFNFNLVIAVLLMSAVAVVIVRMMHSQFLNFNRRIEERSAAETSMKMAIREKETLLAEVHHRVKNNLAVITSLLNLQMNLVNNEYTKNVLRESRNRVSSMALIHQKLYQHANVEQINFGLYASELVQEIKRSYPDNTTETITVSLNVENIPLSLTKAVPAGLMLNELLSNCYKHAFPGRKSGTISIGFKKSGEQCILEVADNGIGLSGDFNIEKQESLGMTIIHSLAQQIDAEIKLSGNTGMGTNVKAVFMS